MTTEQPPEPGILTQAAPAARRASSPAGDSGVAATPRTGAGPVPAGAPVVPPTSGVPRTRASQGPVSDTLDAPPFAAWWRRAAASVLDAWLVATVSFVFGGRFDVSWGIPHVTSGRVAHPSGAWWVAVALLLVLQAYTGWTPGKRALGIAVVREEDGRPLGLLVTVGREVAHLVDALTCFVGYLRPLWHARRRTFADSIVGSDVRVTRKVPSHPVVRWLRRRGVPLPSGQVATTVAGALCTVAVLALIPSGASGGGADEACQTDPSVQITSTGVPVLGEIGPTADGGWTETTSVVDDKWLTSPTPRLLEARVITQGWVSERRIGITRSSQPGGESMFWWVYGGPVTTLTAVLGPTRPDGSRSVIDDAHTVRLEVDVADGTATINGGSARVTASGGGIVGVSFVPSEPVDASDALGWTAAVEPADGAFTSCGERH